MKVKRGSRLPLEGAREQAHRPSPTPPALAGLGGSFSRVALPAHPAPLRFRQSHKERDFAVSPSPLFAISLPPPNPTDSGRRGLKW